jgi:glycosyltransferase involved in cell wall biosynthesis
MTGIVPNPRRPQSGGVSIAMATYNGSRYIGQQLQSLAKQSHAPAELVVTDDGSTDDTIQIVERFAATAPFPVRIQVNGTRLGYRTNFMRAAHLCECELIAFCDQDDVWYPDKLQRCVGSFDDELVLMVYHNADVVRTDGRIIGTLDAAHSDILVHEPLSLPPWITMRGLTQVVRRNLLLFSDLRNMSIDENNPGECMAHDRWFYFLASVFGQVCNVRRPLAAYRQHDNNVFGWREHGGWQQRLSSLLTNRGELYRKYAQAAESRAVILNTCKERLDGSWLRQAVVGAQLYGKIARSLERRPPTPPIVSSAPMRWLRPSIPNVARHDRA